jgi:hypothetical protein
MDGQKIAMAREAVAHATRLLKPNDNLAIVCYDEEVTTVLEKTPASQEAKRLALEKLAKIAARGSTDLHGGWTRGAQLLATPSSQSDAIAKVMLMTDGLANHGVVDRSELLEVARQLRAAGVITSTFGVGQDFDENLLSQMAIEGGGHFYFIETPKQIPDFLASELGETLEVVARDVLLEFVCDAGVEVSIVNDLPIEQVSNRARIRLGHLVSDQEVELVVAVAFKGTQASGSSLGVQCRLSDRDGVLPSLPIEIQWRAVDTAVYSQQAINADVVLAAARMLADRARGEALRLNAEGKLHEAQQVIAEVLKRLHALAADDARVVRIIDSLEREAKEVGQAMNAMARKVQHFVAYQALHSREAGGTARRSKRP